MLDPNPSPNPDPDPNPNNSPNPNADPNPNPNADPDPTPTPTPSPNQARSRCSTSSRRAPAACLTAARPTSATPPHISQDLPRSPHISQDLPRSPEISPYLPISPHISPYPARLTSAASRPLPSRYAEICGDMGRYTSQHDGQSARLPPTARGARVPACARRPPGLGSRATAARASRCRHGAAPRRRPSTPLPLRSPMQARLCSARRAAGCTRRGR